MAYKQVECTKTPALQRGAIGGGIGLVGGAVAGYVISDMLGLKSADEAAAAGTPVSVLRYIFGPTTLALVGLGLGVALGTRKPTCEF